MRSLVLSFVACFLLFIQSSGADPKEYADSLESILPGTSGKERFSTFHRLAETYQRIDLDQSWAYSDSALATAKFLGRDDLMARALNTQGKLQHIKGQYLMASISFSSALTYASKGTDRKLMMLLTNALGISYLMAGEFDKAFEHFSTVERYFRELGSNAQVASTLLNIGSLYKMRGDLGMARGVLTEALEFAETTEHQELTLKCLSALGKVYESIGEFDEAMRSQVRALAIGQERGYPTLIISCKISIGQLYQAQKEYVRAQAYYQEALDLAEQSGISQMVQYLTFSMGKLSKEEGHLWEALALLERAEILAEKLDSEGALLESITQLADLHKEMGNYQKALQYTDRGYGLRFERSEKLHSEKMAEMFSAYELEKTNRELEDLRQEQILSRYNTIGISMFAGFAFLALLALYIRYRERQKSFSILGRQHEKIQLQNRLLQEQNHEIEEKSRLITEKSKEIEMQNERLSLVNMELKHFARAASHDLREPLRAIRSYMNLLGTKYEESFDNRAKEFLSMASAGAVRMEDLLNDLYQHAQVGRSQEDLKEVQLNQVVKDVLHDLSVSIRETNAKIVTESLPTVMGYRTELRMMLQNLVSNAIKFTTQGSQPKVMVIGGEDDRNWYIEVSDQGIGIPEPYQQQIFGIFERLHSREEFAGSGIGLATVDKVVKHHGGTISLDSKAGFGTTFKISLPKS